jgi:hypothetical protein
MASQNMSVEGSLKDAVSNAQESWGRGVVHIGAAGTWDEAYRRASDFVQSHYVGLEGSLLFCPTKAAEHQFRPTLKDAVSYFVGGDSDHPEDHGFALEPWVNVRFENAGIFSDSGLVLAMGNYFFKTQAGNEVKVEYTFAYEQNEGGKLGVRLHHSALPFSG